MTKEVPRELAIQLDSMAFSQVVSAGTTNTRTCHWYNNLVSLGLGLPLFVVHDIGTLLISRGTEHSLLRFSEGERIFAGVQDATLTHTRALLGNYRKLLVDIHRCESVQRIGSLAINNDIVVALLYRMLQEIFVQFCERNPSAPKSVRKLDVDMWQQPSAMEKENSALSYASMFLEILCDSDLHVVTQAELIRTDTIRLLGVFDTAGEGRKVSFFADTVDLVDLIETTESVDASDIASFSMDLLPSVLETKRSRDAQRFAFDGYASIDRKGSVDSLMMTEFAHDDMVFEQRYLHQEILYFSHEKQADGKEAVHLVLVDSSASMRGERQVFARGVALALIKKKQILGESVVFRFFDSRLHPAKVISSRGRAPVPYILSFHSENGRNYTKVFEELRAEVLRYKNKGNVEVHLYVITHGQCYVPLPLVETIVKNAFVYGVFVLPSSFVLPEFAGILHRSQVVTAEQLVHKANKKNVALHIVDSVARKQGRAPGV